jgi:DNA-binding transcriptional LysR family regulator
MHSSVVRDNVLGITTVPKLAGAVPRPIPLPLASGGPRPRVERDPGRWILQLRYFLVAANAPSFRRAAQELYVSQPALSRRIAALEHGMGVQLFERNTRGVHLTGAGTVLAREGQELIDAATQTIQSVRAAAERKRARIKLGIPLQSSIMAQLVAHVSSQLADIELIAIEGSSHHQVQHLLAGTIDMAVVTISAAEESLEWIDLRSFDFAMLVAPTHPLASEAEVPLAAFAKDIIGFPDPQFHPEAHQFLVQCCRQAGFDPRIHAEHEDRESAATVSLRVVTRGTVEFAALDFDFRPELGTKIVRVCDPVPRMPLRLAWLRGKRTELVRRVIESVEEIRAAE